MSSPALWGLGAEATFKTTGRGTLTSSNRQTRKAWILRGKTAKSLSTFLRIGCFGIIGLIASFMTAQVPVKVLRCSHETWHSN